MFTFPRLATKHRIICCTNVTPWNPPPVTYTLKDDTTKGEFLPSSITLFETLHSNQAQSAESVTIDTKPVTKFGYINRPVGSISHGNGSDSLATDFFCLFRTEYS
ncbi:hypothetical protein Hanom_Chr02g00156621 [Helianthus anomalus]